MKTDPFMLVMINNFILRLKIYLIFLGLEATIDGAGILKWIS